MPLYMEMSQNINKTIRHLKFCYISILTNLLRTRNITKYNKIPRHYSLGVSMFNTSLHQLQDAFLTARL